MDKLNNDIKDALLKRATGFEYQEQKITSDKNGKIINVEVNKKYQLPDLAAIKIIENYKQKGMW